MDSLRPVIVKMGLCSGVEGSLQDVFSCIKNSQDTLSKQTLFESPRFREKLFAVAKNIPTKSSYRHYSRCVQILFAALDSALEGFDVSKFEKSKIGVFLGTSIGGIFEIENAVSKFWEGENDNLDILKTFELATITEFVSKKIRSGGMSMTFSTACSSSGLAVDAAKMAIQSAELDLAVVCGVDSLSRMTVGGFGSLQLLSASKCKPFDKNRDGINLGEGAGVLLITSEVLAQKNNLDILAYVSGTGCTSDAYHPTAPHPEALGVLSAMTEALREAHLDAQDIDYFAAHGTGTQGNDVAEFKAFKALCNNKKFDYSSLKRNFGHTLGASGVVNIISSIMAMNASQSLPNAGLEVLDESINIPPVKVSEDKKIENVISNSLGFGGNNASVLITKNPSKSAEYNRAELYMYASKYLHSKNEELLEKISDGGKILFDSSKLLPEIPVLKKRKWAHLQKMILSTALDLLKDVPQETLSSGIASVCIGSGLGMVDETEKFAKNNILKKESEPMPQAFTNSVHNAISSVLSIHCGFKGLNSVVSAKEISFESALWQAWRNIDFGKSKMAIVGAADECTDFVEAFLKGKAKCNQPLTELSAAYFIAPKIEGLEPKSKLCAIHFGRGLRNHNAELEWLKSSFEKSGIDFASVNLWLSSHLNIPQKSDYVDALKTTFSIKDYQDLTEILGGNYSNSSMAMIVSLAKGVKGLCASYNIASTGAKSLLIFENL